jgi:hypothetical protein
MYKGTKQLRMIGIGLVSIALFIVGYTFYSIKGTVVTMGQVVNIDEIHNKSSQTTAYIPTFSFIDEEGNKRMTSTRYSVESFNYAIGEMVEIYYDPDNFSSVRVTSFTAIWRLSLFLGGFGLFIIFLSFKMDKSSFSQ